MFYHEPSARDLPKQTSTALTAVLRDVAPNPLLVGHLACFDGFHHLHICTLFISYQLGHPRYTRGRCVASRLRALPLCTRTSIDIQHGCRRRKEEAPRASKGRGVPFGESVHAISHIPSLVSRLTPMTSLLPFCTIPLSGSRAAANLLYFAN